MDTHTHARTGINTYSTLLQGSHAENCFGHGDEEKEGGLGCGAGGGGGLFNLHF